MAYKKEFTLGDMNSQTHFSRRTDQIRQKQTYLMTFKKLSLARNFHPLEKSSI